MATKTFIYFCDGVYANMPDDLRRIISDGWKITSHAVAGNNNRWCFSYVLEKDDVVPNKDQMQILPITLGNAQYGIKLALENLPPEGEDGYCDVKIIKNILSEHSKLIDNVATTLGIIPK